jgi:hypothetical protein
MPLTDMEMIRMSLITLTFNNSSSRNNASYSKVSKGKVRIIKTEQFFGTEEVCVIGKLVNGGIASEMLVSGTENKIVSVESNYGNGFCQKQGAQVVLMVSGANKEDYQSGQEIEFEKAQEIAIVKPQGKIIIA